MDTSKIKVAVVGGGPAGMAALKELRGAGFDVTLFERRDDIGGIWTWTPDRTVTTALKETRVCNNKFLVSMTDFPMPKEYPPFIGSQELGAYLRAYGRHFDLHKNVKFGKTVTAVRKTNGSRKWQLVFADEPDKPQEFDRVVWATGGFVNAKAVVLEGQEKFAGRILHSQDVRDLEEFKDENVVILGIGNTAGDIAISLVNHAKEVYISHRRGVKITKRADTNGVPADLLLSESNNGILWRLEASAPWLWAKIMDSAVDGNFKAHWGENKPEWGLVQCPSIRDGFHLIMCNDDLVPFIKEGKITSTKGIKRITGPKSVELDDGTVLEDIDTIIASIGYKDDMGLLSDAVSFVPAPGDAAPLPNLYMGIFPPEHPDSFAILSNVHVNAPQIPVRDLAAMALTQIWLGNSKLPDRPAMDAWLINHQAWIGARIARSHGVHRGEVPSIQYMPFLHEAAGTGLLEHLGWGPKAWKFWWSDSELYRAVAHGPSTGLAYRLFETGKRPAWEGARKAILEVQAEVDEIKKKAAEKKKIRA
ncbi:flavin monooxygenase-like protein [Xylariales sp. PMI_506]|nr:flavin monooxygenase-like protein [Xylariales sp. PMI_506]